MSKSVYHWADIAADKIIRERGDKDYYTLASGITPSGTVHFGNFREVITVDLVARALRSRGKNVRFIFSWDDFDTLRKVPNNIPNQAMLAEYLYQPIVDVPDPWGTSSSYARNREERFEGELNRVGVECEYLYQSERYRAGDYKKEILQALHARDVIRGVLNKYRTQALSDSWLPVSVYCPVKKTDRLVGLSWDGKMELAYQHESGYEGTISLDNPEHLRYVKLPWRVDWPMRWAKEGVDFEPGGKDHSSDGGSFTTAQEIVSAVYNSRPPVYLQYDFVSVKGQGGKMSSSKGNLVSLTDVLEVYEPEMVRWIFASYKPNVDFSVGFDAEVIKNYEEYDRMERLAHGLEEGNPKKTALAKRVYEFCQRDEILPEKMPVQPSFRHLTTLLQIFDGDHARIREMFANDLVDAKDEQRLANRINCAQNWLAKHAPEEFKFSVNEYPPQLDLPEAVRATVIDIHSMLSSRWTEFEDDKHLHNSLYECIHANNADPAEVFKAIYQLIIARDRGPRLASFIITIGRERVLPLLAAAAFVGSDEPVNSY